MVGDTSLHAGIRAVGVRDRRVSAVVAVVLIHLLLAFATGTLTSKAIWGTDVGNLILARGPNTLCALAMLSATTFILSRRDRTAAAPAE